MNLYQHSQLSPILKPIKKQTYLANNLGHSPKSVIKLLFNNIKDNKYIISPCYYDKNKEKSEDNLDGYQLVISGKEKYKESSEIAIQRELLEEIGIYIDIETIKKNIFCKKNIKYKNNFNKESIYSITYSIIDLDTHIINNPPKELIEEYNNSKESDNFSKRIIVLLTCSNLEKIAEIMAKRNRLSSDDIAGELVYIQPKAKLQKELNSMMTKEFRYQII